ncbi:MAG: ABC transporter substrate-binding protein [Desulfovibrionaceae bacterium]|nr:ABC transporter substrate-binding protein [Desulfovibrionaceae bacterium]
MCVAMATSAIAAEPIKVGIYLPLTGQNAFGGQLELEGMQLAHKEMSTVIGRPVELIVMDNKSDKTEAATTVERLTSKDKVTAILGSYASSLSLAGGEVAEKAKTPVIGTSCTNPLVTEGKQYYSRACFIDPYQGAAAATYAVNNLGAKKAAIMKEVGSDYAVGLAKFFADSFKKMGGEIVSNLNYNTGDQDFTAQLTQIIAQKPDLLFIPAYFAEGAIIMKQARELGGEFRIMGGDAMDNPKTVEIGGSAVEGFLHTSFPYDMTMPNMNEAAKRFTEAWKATYPGKEPNANAALGYTTYMMLMEAIKTAGSDDRDAINKAIRGLKDFPAAIGTLTIDAKGDAQIPVGIIEIKDGKRVYLGEVEPKV